jgi:outer membrane protein assembly factor BamB
MMDGRGQKQPTAPTPVGRTARHRAWSAACLAAGVALTLTACAGGPTLPRISDLNPFAEKETPLPGKRVAIPIGGTETGSVELASAERPIVLPPPRSNDTWTQAGGNPGDPFGHLAAAASLRSLWSADIGSGSTKLGRLLAPPVVYGGRVYTIDVTGRVSAFALSGGSAVWRVQVRLEGDGDREASGGGLAAQNGRLFAVTGFGVVAALDANSGKKLWDRNLSVPVRAAPAAAADRVLVSAIDGRTFALGALDGADLWVHRGTPETASLATSAAPVVDGDIVAVPHASGEVAALEVSTGRLVWSESLARTRTASSLAAMSDAARPTIDGATVFAVGHAGRMIATSTRTGERLWTLPVAGIQAPWVAGDMVYVVDTAGQVRALGRRDGALAWSTKLSGSKVWAGPVLAGGRLWLASDKGKLVAIDAVSGKVSSTQDIGGPVFVPPIAAAGRLFLVTDKGRLVVFG